MGQYIVDFSAKGLSLVSVIISNVQSPLCKPNGTSCNLVIGDLEFETTLVLPVDVCGRMHPSQF